MDDGPREVQAHIGRGHLLHVDRRFLCLGETGNLLWLDLGPDRQKILQRSRLFNAPFHRRFLSTRGPMVPLI